MHLAPFVKGLSKGLLCVRPTSPDYQIKNEKETSRPTSESSSKEFKLTLTGPGPDLDQT